MSFFKSNPITEPTKEALEKSISNNLKTSNVLQFIFFGLLTLYCIFWLRTGIYHTELLIFAAIVAVFIAMYMIVFKMDKARLEIYKATHEE